MEKIEEKKQEPLVNDFPEHGHNESDYERHHQMIFDEIINVIVNTNCKNILDIGAATGVMYDKLPNRGNYNISAVEIVSDFLPSLKFRNIDAVVCDINKTPLPYDDNTFDVVVFSGILEHTLKPKENVDEINRVLVPGGIMILVAPNAMSLSRRWNYLRGRNPYWTLIDNLISKIGYLRRCSIFYSADNIIYLLKDNYHIKQINYINEDSYESRKKSVIMHIINFFQTILPRYREVILVVAEK